MTCSHGYGGGEIRNCGTCAMQSVLDAARAGVVPARQT